MKFLFLFLVSTSAFAWEATKFKMPSDSEIKKKLTSLQYSVMRDEGTERPFKNEYHNNHEPGIYVDRISGEPLFSSVDKYDSGTGWPSFTKPLDSKVVTLKTDTTLFAPRTEVRSHLSGSHLGHVFDDGPKPLGKRFCMNSASLRFIPVKDLEKEGYGEFKNLFAGK
jgi:methionine-R-sulfoxide reductase